MLASHHGFPVQPQGQLGLYSEMHLKQQQDQTINVSEGTAGNRENRAGLRLGTERSLCEGGAEPQRRNESWPARLRAGWGHSGIRRGGASVGRNVKG